MIIRNRFTWEFIITFNYLISRLEPYQVEYQTKNKNKSIVVLSIQSHRLTYKVCCFSCYFKPRSVNTIGRVTQHAESQNHGVYLHLLTKLSQSCHVVYHAQPIVMVYTPQNLWYTSWYAESTKFGDLARIFIGLVWKTVSLCHKVHPYLLALLEPISRSRCLENIVWLFSFSRFTFEMTFLKKEHKLISIL